jgi:molybdopterin-guanine dinucleotide biosynthesis protein A
MRRDKSGMTFRGRPLWEHQLATLRETAPAELFISGRHDGPYAGSDCEIIRDEMGGLGPLAGVTSALRHARCERLLVLAVDLPQMTSSFLMTLLREAARLARGVVPRDNDCFEPLVAVYSRACLPIAEEHLHAADRSMQRFVRAALRRGFVAEYPLAEAQRRYFTNVNAPADFREAAREE